ncbi:MAG TPA: M67 family metallopeptidase [Anaerolineaceae bacterium]|nr:M67 family metallopeptidase [Chloroflexota bacterium]HNZ01745.1 M67 family metallopeptidase [Anaerolineaceae bacterium]HQF46450.1 M67 family metallopeptidase [Anaerolineaceae bacterium]
METFQLARTHVEQMRMDVCLRLPEEACGLLGGRQNRAEIVLPVTNSLHSSTRFFLDPEEMIAAILQLESRGMDVVGIYHSHPAGPAVPSETDLRETTWREAVILIWSPGREDWQLRAFRVDSGGWREVIMTVME